MKSKSNPLDKIEIAEEIYNYFKESLTKKASLDTKLSEMYIRALHFEEWIPRDNFRHSTEVVKYTVSITQVDRSLCKMLCYIPLTVTGKTYDINYFYIPIL
jgi:hypothetical protein